MKDMKLTISLKRKKNHNSLFHFPLYLLFWFHSSICNKTITDPLPSHFWSLLWFPYFHFSWPLSKQDFPSPSKLITKESLGTLTLLKLMVKPWSSSPWPDNNVSPRPQCSYHSTCGTSEYSFFLSLLCSSSHPFLPLPIFSYAYLHSLFCWGFYPICNFPYHLQTDGSQTSVSSSDHLPWTSMLYFL